MHKETHGTSELVFLPGQHPNGQRLVRKIGSRQFEVLSQFRFIDIYGRCCFVGTARFELFEAVLRGAS